VSIGKDGKDPNRIGKSGCIKYKKALAELQGHCEGVDLEVSSRLVKRAIIEAEQFMSYGDVAIKMGELQRCVEAELESKYFFFIPPDQAKYLVLYEIETDGKRGQRTDVGDEIKRFQPCMDAFPSITYDLEQAGKCFATNGFTACVFHLMRVCEYGLASLAQTLNADPGISSWGKLLRKIDTKIEENDKLHPEGWIPDREFYAESATLILNVKNCWRNSVSHIRRTYDEGRARRIFNSVEALMGHLASRLKETPLPSETLLSNPDSEQAQNK
jgi:hypothetical protein